MLEKQQQPRQAKQFDFVKLSLRDFGFCAVVVFPMKGKPSKAKADGGCPLRGVNHSKMRARTNDATRAKRDLGYL